MQKRLTKWILDSKITYAIIINVPQSNYGTNQNSSN